MACNRHTSLHRKKTDSHARPDTRHQLLLDLDSVSNFKWVSCYTDYQCARLDVPLVHEKTNGKKVQLALVKLPAKKIAKFQGTLFLQVRLGTSATNLVLAAGGLYQTPTLEGWDIVGWDVRGNYDHYEILAKACKSRSDDFLPYIVTPNNARDLGLIIKAIGSKGKLAFWGYQYATLLGETFAGLYPNDLDYLILDGVVQGENAYGFGDTGVSSIQDAEKAFNVFFTSCAAAGNATCAFHAATPELIKARYQKLEKALLAKPVPVPEAENGVAGPNIYGALGAPLDPLPTTGTGGSFEYQVAIQALDADPYRLSSLKDFEPFLKRVLRKSPAVAGVTVGSIQLRNAAWKVPAAVNFNGDGFFNVHTRATVLLYLRLTHRSAKSMSRKFRNSRVLIINAVGFTLLQYASDCRLKAVAAYLNENTLPARDAICQLDDPPFGVPLGNL
ncbi:MAG: hypothetical protein Q9213_004029 [Squamulea squamosa]